MEHSLHQHRKMLLHAQAAADAAEQPIEAAGATGSAAPQQQQQQQAQQQQMVAEFMEEGHNSVNALLIEQFQPPENGTAVEQGIGKPASEKRGRHAAVLP
jgi:hypothetical protein